jgi:L-rhamnonate dehydratase
VKIKKLTASLHEMEVILPDVERPLENRQFVFCEVESEEGITGFGITGQFMPWAIIAALEHHIWPIVRDLDPRDTEAVHARVGRKLNQRAYTGVISNALAALDIALWDIRGKKEGRSIAQLLGGHSKEASTYVTFGYPSFDAEQLVHYARKFANEGCDALKMVVAQSQGGWKEDARRIRLVRQALGPEVELMIDANYLFSPLEARLLAREVEDCNLTWFEEPVHQNDARALADLRLHTAIPIAAGQMEGHRWRYRELVLAQAVDVLQPNCCFNGGYTETQKVAHMAQAFNLPIANGGGWPHFNMHTMAGLMNGGRCEFHYGMWQAGKRFFKGAPDPDLSANSVAIPDAPGLGFEPDHDQLRDTRQSDPERYRPGGMHERAGPGA